MVPIPRTRIAFHEAGHALTAIGMGVKFTKVTLPLAPVELPPEGVRPPVVALGWNDIGYRETPDRKDAFNEIAVALAGSVAECIWLSKQAEQASSEALAWLIIGGEGDLARARERLLVLKQDLSYIADAVWFNHRSLNLNWPLVCHVAEELLKRGELNRADIVAMAKSSSAP